MCRSRCDHDDRVANKFLMKNWLLLDNQSTADIFCNANVLENVRGTSDVLYLDTNGGTLKTTTKGTLRNYGEVWYSPEAITNILSLKNIIKNSKSPMTAQMETSLWSIKKMENI